MVSGRKAQDQTASGETEGEAQLGCVSSLIDIAALCLFRPSLPSLSGRQVQL